MITKLIIIALLGAIIQGLFIHQEHQKKYLRAVILKGLASLFFCIIGLIAYRNGPTAIGKPILFGLFFGLLGDVFLNLRFLSEKNGQKLFLIGILFFLIGHILYLAAIYPLSRNPLLWIVIGAVCAAALLAYIFKTMEVKIAFKIFGVFYLGAIIIMTAIALGNLINDPNTFTITYFAGALAFMLSDIVLIFNTFGSTTRFSMRIANLSLYYLGQLLIAFSLFNVPVK